MNTPYVRVQGVSRHIIALGKECKILNFSSLVGMIALEDISAYAGTKGTVN